MQVARWAFTNRMGTLMLQSGELPTQKRLEYLQRVVAACRDATVALDIEQRGLDPKVGLRGGVFGGRNAGRIGFGLLPGLG
jgi:hypothetical protein